jgi:hypothetical protein
MGGSRRSFAARSPFLLRNPSATVGRSVFDDDFNAVSRQPPALSQQYLGTSAGPEFADPLNSWHAGAQHVARGSFRRRAEAQSHDEGCPGGYRGTPGDILLLRRVVSPLWVAFDPTQPLPTMHWVVV